MKFAAEVEIMKSDGSNDSGFGLFASATEVSQPSPWFLSLRRQIHELCEERKHPQPKFEITAQRDPAALEKLIETPSALASLVSQVWGLIDDTLHPKMTRVAAAPVEVKQIWSKRNTAAPKMMSAAIHGMLLVLALMPWTSLAKKPPRVNETVVTVYTPVNLVLNLPQKQTQSGGGGGGGKREKTPASLGRLPRAADKQLAPPDPAPPKNPDPTLIVEPTVVAPQLAQLPRINLLNIGDIGDPLGVPGPPSSGPGIGGASAQEWAAVSVKAEDRAWVLAKAAGMAADLSATAAFSE